VSETDDTRGAEAGDGRDRRHAGYKVIAIVLALSTAMAVFLAFRLRQSDHHLSDTQHRMEEAGASLDVPGCLDLVLDWYGECEAMAGLCQQSVSRMMGACLAAQDRTEYCDSVEGQTTTTAFGNDDCRSEERGLERRMRTACAASYRAIHVHCSPSPEPVASH
jgi:hypothetical protein